MKILIADDNPGIRETVRELLEEVAETILECQDGAAAIHLWEQSQPDWILMDIQMPVLDGFQATREIVRYGSRTRVIILTAFDSQVLRQQARRVGAWAYVLKDNLASLPALLQIDTTVQPDF